MTSVKTQILPLIHKVRFTLYRGTQAFRLGASTSIPVHQEVGL